MVNELKDVGHVLSKEQQLKVVIDSLPQRWQNMKMHLTHNVNNKIMKYLKHHFKLKGRTSR